MPKIGETLRSISFYRIDSIPIPYDIEIQGLFGLYKFPSNLSKGIDL
jgi:hypothetical protein